MAQTWKALKFFLILLEKVHKISYFENVVHVIEFHLQKVESITARLEKLSNLFEFSKLSELSCGTVSQTGNDQTNISRVLHACFWPHFGLACT